jgi:acylphosphatase
MNLNTSVIKMNHIAKHIIFIGRVQGVGFRYTSFNIAKRYQLVGFIRNLPDGTVEMVAQGPDDDICACIRDIKEYFETYVSDTRILEIPLRPKYTEFKITF